MKELISQLNEFGEHNDLSIFCSIEITSILKGGFRMCGWDSPKLRSFIEGWERYPLPSNTIEAYKKGQFVVFIWQK